MTVLNIETLIAGVVWLAIGIAIYVALPAPPRAHAHRDDEGRRARSRSSSTRSSTSRCSWRSRTRSTRRTRCATAVKLAARRRRGIHVLVTITVPTSSPIDAPLPEQERRAQQTIDSARVLGGRRVTGHWEKVRAGQAGRRIVDEAREIKARAIVMPRPRKRAGGSLFGRTLETVLEERPVPGDHRVRAAAVGRAHRSAACTAPTAHSTRVLRRVAICGLGRRDGRHHARARRRPARARRRRRRRVRGARRGPRCTWPATDEAARPGTARAARAAARAAPAAVRADRGRGSRAWSARRRSSRSRSSAVGASIYFTLGVVADHALGLTPLAFLAAGVFFVVTMMTYVEGNSLHPERGGASTFARYAFDELWSFIAGWAILLDYLIVMALCAFAIPHYLAAFWGDAGDARHRARDRGRARSAGRSLVEHPRAARRPLGLRAPARACSTCSSCSRSSWSASRRVWDWSAIVDSIELGEHPEWDDLVFARGRRRARAHRDRGRVGLAGEIRAEPQSRCRA